MIESIDLKLISVCLINDYLLIANLHIFVYGSEECATISLECTKVNAEIVFAHLLNKDIFSIIQCDYYSDDKVCNLQSGFNLCLRGGKDPF